MNYMVVYSLLYLYKLHNQQILFPLSIAVFNFCFSRDSNSHSVTYLFGIFNALLIGCFSWYTWPLTDFRPFNSVCFLSNSHYLQSAQLTHWHSVYRFTLLHFISYYFDTQYETKGSVIYDFQEFFIYIFYSPTYVIQ